MPKTLLISCGFFFFLSAHANPSQSEKTHPIMPLDKEFTQWVQGLDLAVYEVSPFTQKEYLSLKAPTLTSYSSRVSLDEVGQEKKRDPRQTLSPLPEEDEGAESF